MNWLRIVARHPRIAASVLIPVGFMLTVVFLLNFPVQAVSDTPQFGVTFTPGQAESFGLDWHKTYTALLDDLGVRRFRLVAYWDEIQPTRDRMDFSRLDEQMDELAKRQGKALLAIGRKVPRWPECHDPKWISGATKEQIEDNLIRYVSLVVERYKDHPALGQWQVENEILFPFGICPNMLSLASLKREIARVRALDSTHQIVVTDSGEWTPWAHFAGTGDVLGSSLYRGAWNDYVGYIPFPVGPGWYQIRGALLGQLGMKVIISELQAEPWGKKAIQEMTPEETLSLFPPEALAENIAFSRRVGFDEVYLWGAEWWYWLLEKGDARIWEQMKELFTL